MNRIRDRRRPTCYRVAPTTNSPGRHLILSTGRGDVRLSAGEAAALGAELIRAAAGLDPAIPVEHHALVLALAERVAAQSEILQANAGRACPCLRADA